MIQMNQRALVVAHANDNDLGPARFRRIWPQLTGQGKRELMFYARNSYSLTLLFLITLCAVALVGGYAIAEPTSISTFRKVVGVLGLLSLIAGVAMVVPAYSAETHRRAYWLAFFGLVVVLVDLFSYMAVDTFSHLA